MEIANVAEAIEWQAQHSEKAGAPITARIIRGELAILETDTATGRRMANWAGLSLEDAMPLRIAGGLHFLHLSGEDRRLEPVYAGRITDQPTIDRLVGEVTETFDTVLLPWLDSPPQTNEAGRSASIMAGLLWLSGKIGQKFDLVEIGASAGINTMMDRYFYDLGGTTAGPVGSAMIIRPEWQGAPPPQNPVQIAGIKGCDIAPVDLSDSAHALRLRAYIWADATERMTRMETAIAMATSASPDLVKMDAGEFVAQQLALPQDAGVARVLFHSVMWQYLPAETRNSIQAMMEEAGQSATAEKPLAWIQLETNRATFRHELAVKYWPNGGEEWAQLGEAHPHGAWVKWL